MMLGIRTAIVVVAAMLSSTATAAEPVAPLLQQNAGDDVVEGVGSYAPSRTLLGKAAYDERGREVGEIDDVLIDPYTGMAVILVIEPDVTSKQKYRLLVPFKAVAPIRLSRITIPTDRESIMNGPSIAEGENARPYRRPLAMVPFEYYGIKPIWPGVNKREGSPLKDDDLLVFVKSLRRLPVTSGDGNKLGQVDDVVISFANGKIAYAVLRVESDSTSGDDVSGKASRFAVPLSAFVSPPGETSWLLELSPEKLLKTDSIEQDRWPVSVSPNWSRYIEDAYGDDTLDGVQRSRAK